MTVIKALRDNYRPPPAPPANKTVPLAARAALVAEHLGAGLPVLPGPFQHGRVWLGRVIKVAAGLVELALPGKARSIVGRHLPDVAIIAAVLMIVLGGLVGGPGVTSFGWLLLMVVVGVRLVIALLASWLAGGRWWIGVGIAFAVVAGFVVYGLVSWSGWPRALAMFGIGLVLGLVLAALPPLARWRAAKAQERQRGARKKAAVEEAKPTADQEAKKPKGIPRLPVAAFTLALVVFIAIGGAAAGHAQHDLGDRICRLDDAWYRTVAARAAVIVC
jgi:hypothetical protein